MVLLCPADDPIRRRCGMICKARPTAAAARLIAAILVLLVLAATNAISQEAAIQPSAGSAAPGQTVIGIGQLRRDLTPWSMFLSADIVVQAVIVGLVLASVVTWTVWLAKGVELMFAKRKLRRTLAAIRGERSLADAAARVGNGGGLVQGVSDAAQ